VTEYLRLEDYLVICEEILGRPAEAIAAESRLELAESALAAPAAGLGEVEVYPDLDVKAAVLCVHLIKNHPLIDGNKRAGFVAMIEFLARNGATWTPPSGDPDGEASAQVILDVASGPGDTDAVNRLARWIRRRTTDQTT